MLFLAGWCFCIISLGIYLWITVSLNQIIFLFIVFVNCDEPRNLHKLHVMQLSLRLQVISLASSSNLSTFTQFLLISRQSAKLAALPLPEYTGQLLLTQLLDHRHLRAGTTCERTPSTFKLDGQDKTFASSWRTGIASYCGKRPRRPLTSLLDRYIPGTHFYINLLRLQP